MSAPATLAQSARCYCFDDGTAKSVAIYLLASQAKLLSMSPSALASAASCYCFRDDTWKSVVAYLLDNINSGGGGGQTCVTGGNTPPVGVPPCDHSVWIQGPGPNFGVWFGDTNGWSAVAAIAQGP